MKLHSLTILIPVFILVVSKFSSISMGNVYKLTSDTLISRHSFTPVLTVAQLTATYIKAVQPSQSINEQLLLTLISGGIGVVGAILGVIISYFLTLRRDRINRDYDERKKIREDLTAGASAVAQRHARTKIPFDGGDALFFPHSVSKNKEELIHIMKEFIDTNIDEPDSHEKLIVISRLVVEKIKEFQEDYKNGKTKSKHQK